LLDVEMPGVDGHEVCKRLRADSAFDAVAILFVSAHSDPASRLAAYDVGANDYITKPLRPEEIRYKVNQALKNQDEVAQLKANSQEAFNVAMSAMGDAATLGTFLTLFKEIFRLHDLEQVANRVLETLREMGLSASLQLRAGADSITLNTDGRKSAMEETLLGHISNTEGHIHEFGQRMAFVFGAVTVLIKNSPVDDMARGKLRDYMVMMAEGIDGRLSALKAESLQVLLGHIRTVLAEIDREYKAQQSSMLEAFEVMNQEFSNALMYMGLKESQEATLLGIVETASRYAQESQQRGLAVDQYFAALNNKLAE